MNNINTKLYEIALENTKNIYEIPKGYIKYPYISPGGPYSEHLWDWDSFWTTKALLGIINKTKNLQKKKQLQNELFLYAKGALKNFFYYQGKDGSIPILIKEENKDWFSSTKNKNTNMAKPVMGQFCNLLYKNGALTKDESLKFIKGLDYFYNCYNERYLHKNTGLYLWANDVAIGVDDDPATWGRPSFSSANIFLNSLMYIDLKEASFFADKLGKKSISKKFLKNAIEIKNKIQEYCWNERDGIFYSIDIQCRQNLVKIRDNIIINKNLYPFWNALQIKIMSWVSFMPIWAGIATRKQAKIMITKNLLDKNKFWSNYGIRSLSADEKMYSPEIVRNNPSNWLGPIWIISNYIIWAGLIKYNFKYEANKLADNILNLLNNDYKINSVFHEYYSPNTGKGISGPAFLNWNLLACLMEKKQ